MEIKPLKKRLVVFAVRRRQKLMGSVLFRSDDYRGAFTRAEDLWVLAKGDMVKADLNPGDHVLVSDALELEPYDFKLWEHFENDPRFAQVKMFAEQTGGTVETVITSEGSLLAQVFGDCFQDGTAIV